MNKKLRVALVYPNQDYLAMVPLMRKHRYPNISPRPFPMISLGILYLVSAIRDICDVSYIDNNIEKLSSNDLTQYIIKQKPDIVGFGGTLTEQPQASQVAAAIKNINPGICTIYGGPNASANPEKHVKYFDYVFRGWAEQSLRKFINDWPNLTAAYATEGVCWLSQEDQAKGADHIVQSALNIDIDGIRYPARNVVDLHSYKRQQFSSVCKSPVDIVVASRGCPFKCSFCSSKSIWNQAYKTRCVEAVIDEIKMMMRLYGTETIHFREDNLTANKIYLESLCKELKTLHDEMGLNWICQSRVNALDRDTIRMMKSAGCKVVCCGFESINDETLQYIDKGFCAEDVVHTIELLEEEKMRYSGGFMVGVLNEGEEEIKKTLLFTRNVSQLSHSFVPRGAGRFVGFPVSQTYNEMLAHPELIAYNWQDGELLIPNTYKLSAAQVEQTITKNW